MPSVHVACITPVTSTYGAVSQVISRLIGAAILFIGISKSQSSFFIYFPDAFCFLDDLSACVEDPGVCYGHRYLVICRRLYVLI